MTVCLTGDVHHVSMETRDQAYMDGTEMEAAVEYAEIAADYDVPVTLFVTGKALREEPDAAATLAAMDNVELGGHNYWAFTTPVHKGWRALARATGGRFGSWNGPRPFQAWEIDRTLAAFEDVGVRVRSWRDHAYRHDRHTAELLAEHGVTHFSDDVGPDVDLRCEAGLTVVPINTPPDHEHVYHAFRTPEFVENTDFEGPFGSDAHEPDAWLARVWDAVETRSSDGEPATILAHPACMALADGFEVFERLCDRLGSRHAPAAVSSVAL